MTDMCDDFCISHGREFMRNRFGDPIPYCEACELGLVDCDQCGASGFDTPGTGYGNVCGKCGGQRYLPAPQRS